MQQRDDPRSSGTPSPDQESWLTMKTDTATRETSSDRQEIIARQGMRLPGITLKHLQSAGIYCQPTISVEHQHIAKRYVLRGVESGGAVAEIGAYSSYVDEYGNAMSWLQRVDTVGVNGVHGIVVAPLLVRLQVLRMERTYDLLITRHGLASSGDRQRPQIESSVLFYGRRGCLEMELWGADSSFREAVGPVFYTRAGEPATLPTEFQNAVLLMTSAVCCLGCRHCHLLQPPGALLPVQSQELHLPSSGGGPGS